MSRTRTIFFVIIGLALIAILAGVAAFLLLGPSETGSTTASTGGGEPVEVTIVTALPVEPWVSEAARQFNAENHTLEGHPIQVNIVAMDGLTAMGRYEREEMDPFPTAWIPDSRYLVELVNATFKTKLGRDVFLTDGEYRARPVAISLFAWGIYDSRADVLDETYGDIDWLAIHDAAIAPGGWREIGGDGEWGYFKLIVPHPRKNIGGLAAMISAAGEYYDQSAISVDDVTDPEFQAWLKELMGSVSDYSSLGAYPGENLALFGYSAGDGGQLLESDLLINMAGSMNRWEPLRILYPKYVTWFDFPFTVWIGPETTALEKNAALEFEKYLLSPEVQATAVEYGLRPGSGQISVDQPDSPFVESPQCGIQIVTCCLPCFAGLI
jgi:ABC-type glycerol-3-phosphate transport system substrate-binding protein